MRKLCVILIWSAFTLWLFACSGPAASTEADVPTETKAETTAPTASSETEAPTEAAETEPTEGETEMVTIDPYEKAEGEVYYVGSRGNASFISLILDLAGNENMKTIFIEEGTYDVFAEYMAEVEAGRLTVPPDDIKSPDYFGTYNAFVPNRTKIIGVGKVTLTFTPKKDEITYGASRTWSPLNIYGNVEIENVEVIGKNCRYCLHNDDHNKYPGSMQVYRNCRFEYQLSDSDKYGRLLGFNNTVGFGVDNGSTHLFEDCEIFFNGLGQHSAYYGHNASTPGEASLIVKNCWIHASDESNMRVIRLQTLSHAEHGHVTARIENCTVNGSLMLNMYYKDSVQSFEVTFVNMEIMRIYRTIAAGGTIVDPYEVHQITE
ncbi:MAG: hypothetical protein J5794_06755 [Lachnospiraceae bacterium]|nr:hypothetical protein [Lachnospiraceae bacterium]